MSVRLSPLVVPSLLIHTSTFDVGAALLTGMWLLPGCTGVGGVISVVSESADGVALCDERICISVPVLDKLTLTALSTVGLGSSSSKPTPFLKFGNGTASWYVSVGHPVDGSPSVARLALSGLSAPPPGEKTVALRGLTNLAGADWLEPLLGTFAPIADALMVPLPTSPNTSLSAHAKTSIATTMMAPPTARPASRPLRRRARVSSSTRPCPPKSAPRNRDGRRGAGGWSTGEITSVRSASAVACFSRFRSVDALRIPPSFWTEWAAAAEIWKGMSGLIALGSLGLPSASSSAGASPLGTPDSGSGQRLTSSVYNAAPMPRMSSSGVAWGVVAGNANAT